MRLRGFASSARLVATFACAEASAITEAITAGTLSCVLRTPLLSQCGNSQGRQSLHSRPEFQQAPTPALRVQYCRCIKFGHCITGNGDWRLGWQSGAAAAGPIMALLSCQLPKNASLSSNSPSPCMPKGKAWSFYLLTVCIGRPGDTCKINFAAGDLLKSVGKYQIQSAAEAFRALLRARAIKNAAFADVCKGSGFMAVGSPFGALAPSHFVNHTAAGTISNALQLPVRPA